MLAGILREQSIPSGLGILRNSEGVELMPANIELSGLEVSLVNAMSRETILRQYLDTVQQKRCKAGILPGQGLHRFGGSMDGS